MLVWRLAWRSDHLDFFEHLENQIESRPCLLVIDSAAKIISTPMTRETREAQTSPGERLAAGLKSRSMMCIGKEMVE